LKKSKVKNYYETKFKEIDEVAANPFPIFGNQILDRLRVEEFSVCRDRGFGVDYEDSASVITALEMDEAEALKSSWTPSLSRQVMRSEATPNSARVESKSPDSAARGVEKPSRPFRPFEKRGQHGFAILRRCSSAVALS